MIKRLIFRIIMSFIIATGIMSYIAYLNGIDIRQFIPQLEFSPLPKLKLPPVPNIKLPAKGEQETRPATINKVYKWRGADGSWHFSEELPEGIKPEQVLILNSSTNIVQGLPEPSRVVTDIAPAGD